MARKRLSELERQLAQANDTIEQQRVQLAGCSTAALGHTNDPAKKGDYGWSPAYQDTVDLAIAYEKAKAELAEANALRLERQLAEANDEIARLRAHCHE